MTDLEKLRALFTEFGLDFDESITLLGGSCISLDTENGMRATQRRITGYRSLVAEFCFKPDGSFNNVGIWE